MYFFVYFLFSLTLFRILYIACFFPVQNSCYQLTVTFICHVAENPCVKEYLSCFIPGYLCVGVSAESCESLDGTWYNLLGSELILSHGRHGQIVGEYRTAVEREIGAAGVTHSKVIGQYQGLKLTLARSPNAG